MSNRLTLFAGAAFALVGLTAFLVMRVDQSNEMREQPVLAFPKLAASGQDLAKLVIRGSSSKTTLVKQADGAWLVEELGFYPAKIDLINRLYLDLSTLSLLEKRSAKPENQAAMGLGAPGDGGTGIEITALDKSGGSLAGIIQGKVKDLSANGTPATLFVRRIGEDQAWFARSNLQAIANPNEWVNKSLMSIAPQRISQVDVRASGPDPIQLRRDKPETLDMTLMDIPKGRTQAPAPISALGGALNALYFDTVKAKADIDMTGAQTIRYRLFEGPVIDVRVKRIDGKAYATFTVGPDKDLSEAAAKIVSDLNAKTAPFVFGLSTQKADEMTISKEGLLAKLDGARPPAPKGQN